MIDLSAKIELRDVQNGLRRMQLAGVHLRPVFRMSRKAFRADQRQHEKDRTGKDAPWPNLAPSTIARRMQRARRHGRKRLRQPGAKRQLLGQLPRNFKITFDDRRLVATSRIPWSRSQWKGGRVGHRSRLPRREFMWISDKLLRIVARNAVDYMLTKWKR